MEPCGDMLETKMSASPNSLGGQGKEIKKIENKSELRGKWYFHQFGASDIDEYKNRSYWHKRDEDVFGNKSKIFISFISGMSGRVSIYFLVPHI